MADERQETRRIIAEVARAVDRRLAVEVRELPGGERLQLILTHGTRHGHDALQADARPSHRREARRAARRRNDVPLASRPALAQRRTARVPEAARCSAASFARR